MRLKKTRITIGFEHHAVDVLKKKLPYMQKADVIAIEVDNKIVGAHIDGKKVEHGSLFPHYTERYIKLLKDMRAQGKEVVGSYELTPDEERRQKEAFQQCADAQKAVMEGRIEPEEYVKKYASGFAIDSEIREKNIVNFILKNLNKWKGKTIYIPIGALHTPVLHELKKRLKPRGIEVKAVFHMAGEFGNPRLSQVYGPMSELTRLYRFKKPAANDPTRIKKIVEGVEKMSEKVDREELQKIEMKLAPKLTKKMTEFTERILEKKNIGLEEFSTQLAKQFEVWKKDKELMSEIKKLEDLRVNSIVKLLRRE